MALPYPEVKDVTAEQLAFLTLDAKVLGCAYFSGLNSGFLPEKGTRPTARTTLALEKLMFQGLIARGEDYGFPGPSWVRLVIFPEVDEAELAAVTPWPVTERY